MLHSNLAVIDLKSFLYYSTAIRLSRTRQEWLMNQGKTIFSQIMEYLSLYSFRRCVRKYQDNYKVISFSCLDRLCCMNRKQVHLSI